MKKEYVKPLMEVCTIEPVNMLALSSEDAKDGGGYGRSVSTRRTEWGNLWSEKE